MVTTKVIATVEVAAVMARTKVMAPRTTTAREEAAVAPTVSPIFNSSKQLGFIREWLNWHKWL